MLLRFRDSESLMYFYDAYIYKCHGALWGPEENLRVFFLSIMWVPRIELRSSCLAASPLLPTELVGPA